MKYLLTVIAVISVLLSSAIAGNYPKVSNYYLDVTFIPKQAGIEGQCKVSFDPDVSFGDTASFYLHGEMWVDSILSDGSPIDFTQEKIFYPFDYSAIANKAVLPMPESKSLEIYYRGYLNPSKVTAPSNYMRVDKSGVYLRSLGYSLWFPVFLESWKDDYRVDFPEVIIRTPREMQSIFVGHRLADSVSGEHRISRWKADNTKIFDAQCTAHRFIEKKLGQVYIYSYDDSLSAASTDSILQFVNKCTSKFASMYRSVESEEYYIMEMPKYGDISSNNITGISEDWWHNFNRETWSKRGLAHELVHPFVKIDIAGSDPLFAMIIEGFPSYFHLPILAEFLGQKWYDTYIENTEKTYLKNKNTGLNRRGRPLPEEKPIDKISYNEIGTYKDEFVLNDRVVLFFNFLKAKMGERNFGEFSRELFNSEIIGDDMFRNLVFKHYSGDSQDIHLWLSTNEYPDRFQLNNLH